MSSRQEAPFSGFKKRTNGVFVFENQYVPFSRPEVDSGEDHGLGV